MHDGVFTSKWGSHIKPLLKRLRELLEIVEGKLLRAWGQGRLVLNCVFWVWQELCTHELTSLWGCLQKTGRCQASQHCNVDEEGIHEALLPADEQLAANGCWEREGQLSLETQPLVDFSRSRGWLYTICIQDALIGLGGLSKEGLELGERCRDGLSGTVGEYTYKILF